MQTINGGIFMYEEQKRQKTALQEKELLSALAEAEELAEKKTRIYSRLLTEMSLAQEMEELSKRHAARKQVLQTLLSGGIPQKDGGMSENNDGGDEK